MHSGPACRANDASVRFWPIADVRQAVAASSKIESQQMLIPYWFKTNVGLGYGVTAASQDEAVKLLRHFGYPRPGEEITAVLPGVEFSALDQNHVVPNAGPIAVRGVWFPRHNI